MTANRVEPSDDSWLAGTETINIAAASPPFCVFNEQPNPELVVVSVFGDIDLLTASPLHEHLSRVLAAGTACVVIDLTHTLFLAATALSVLIDIGRAAAQQGTTLQLRAPQQSLPAQVLNTAGLNRLFDIVPAATDTNGRYQHRPGRRTQVPSPRTAPRPDPAASAPVEPVVDTAEDDYEHLIPLQCRYAELASDEPQRNQLRQELIQGYLPVAEHIARRFAGRGEPLEDLIQIATVGLINAIDRFEPGRGSHFLAFAVPTITGEIRRYFRDHGWSTHVPRRLKDLNLTIRQTTVELSQQLGHSPRPSQIAKCLGIPTCTVLEALHAAKAYRSSSLDDVLRYGETTTTPSTFLGELDPQMRLIDDRETLRPLLAQLTPRHRTILILRFFHQLTQQQIAKQVGLSQMQVSRLLRQILDLLHQQMTDSTSTPERRPRSTKARKKQPGALPHRAANSFNEMPAISTAGGEKAGPEGSTPGDNPVTPPRIAPHRAPWNGGYAGGHTPQPLC
jgi:RNA polymerase sigma-B factor